MATRPSRPLTMAATPLALAVWGTDAASQPTTTRSLGTGDGVSPTDGFGEADGLAGVDGAADGEGACALQAARTTETTARRARRSRFMSAGCMMGGAVASAGTPVRASGK